MWEKVGCLVKLNERNPCTKFLLLRFFFNGIWGNILKNRSRWFDCLNSESIINATDMKIPLMTLVCNRIFRCLFCISIDNIWIITISNRVISLFLVRIPLLLLIITVHFSHRENQFLISLQWWFKHIQPLWDRKKVLWLCAQTRMDHSQQLTPVTTNSVIPSLW